MKASKRIIALILALLLGILPVCQIAADDATGVEDYDGPREFVGNAAVFFGEEFLNTVFNEFSGTNLDVLTPAQCTDWNGVYYPFHMSYDPTNLNAEPLNYKIQLSQGAVVTNRSQYNWYTEDIEEVISDKWLTEVPDGIVCMNYTIDLKSNYANCYFIIQCATGSYLGKTDNLGTMYLQLTVEGEGYKIIYSGRTRPDAPSSTAIVGKPNGENWPKEKNLYDDDYSEPEIESGNDSQTDSEESGSNGKRQSDGTFLGLTPAELIILGLILLIGLAVVVYVLVTNRKKKKHRK